jgi:hypothetical protein
VVEKVANGTGFLQALRVALPILITSTAPRSSVIIIIHPQLTSIYLKYSQVPLLIHVA